MSFLEEWKKSLGSTRPWDMLKPSTEYVDSETKKLRFDICKSCPFFISATTQCSKCLCFMNLKTALKHAECPIQKW